MDRLNVRQCEAVRVASAAMRSYVWGPPGTGKTTTVGAFVAGLVASGRRVLVISPYNVAVDEATLSVARTAGADGVVRLGRAGSEVRRQALDLESRLEAAARASGLLAGAQALAAAVTARDAGTRVTPPATVRGCLDALGACVVRRRKRREDPEMMELGHVIATLRKQFRDPARELVTEAQVVACTMALSFVATDVHLRPYDHLVVDEASVVRMPEAVLAALLAGAPVTFFGDPRQLPPVVLADSPHVKRWLAPHPFAMAGVTRVGAADPGDRLGAILRRAVAGRGPCADGGSRARRGHSPLGSALDAKDGEAQQF